MKKILCCILLLLGLCASTPVVNSNHINGISATVTRVVDGDTIVANDGVQELKIRLVNIDTPETNFRGKSQGKPGEDAKLYLQGLLRPGSSIQLEPSEEPIDKYGRHLATIYKKDININALMVRKGLAFPCAIYPNIKGAVEIYKQAELAAKEELGVYGNHVIAPYIWRKLVSNDEFTYYTGDVDRECFVDPEDYSKIRPEKRIFFRSETHAKQFGYIDC